LAAGGGDRSSPGNEEAMIFFRIARNEWRSLKSDSVVWLLLISLAVSVSYAIFNGRQIQRRQKEANEEFVEVEAAAVERYHRLNEETWRKIDAGEITEIPEWSNREFLTPLFSYWDFQLQKSATRPFSPLAFLDLGQSDIYPSAYKPYDPGQFYRETTPSAPQAGNPLSLMIGGFDPAFVVIYLLPLFIIGLSFNLLSSEKESGVLGLLLFHLVYEARAAEIEKIIKPAQDRFDYQYSKQHELFNRLRVMSPAMLCQFALTRLSGSSAEQHDRFMAQVDRNHREWRHFFLKKTLSGDLLRPDDYAKFPYFHYEIEPLSSILAWIKLPLMEIGVLTLIVAAVGLIKFKTYAVIS
jgi:ABC-type transport system involved in multi-copper enzyme maturation permease subunit